MSAARETSSVDQISVILADRADGEAGDTGDTGLGGLDGFHESGAIPLEVYGELLRRSLERCGVEPPAEVGLALIGTDEMTELNQSYMGGSGPTDVLAFPIDGADEVPSGQPALIGDIVICPNVAARAPQPLADELALLVVHGALHLLGHDHAQPAETAVMRALETDLLRALWKSEPSTSTTSPGIATASTSTTSPEIATASTSTTSPGIATASTSTTSPGITA